jgi:DNA-binding HxlR family transcriptional regulator
MWEKWCPVTSLFNQISKMWVLQILRSIYLWNDTFNEIKKSLWNISSKTLSERLKELQENWFIDRKIISEQPIKITYTLSEKWISFSKETEKLNTWAAKWEY